jgi:DNA repair ATPase RecN
VTLKAGGETLTQPLTVQLDPRVKVAQAALQKQLALSLKLARELQKTAAALRELDQLRAQHARPDQELDALKGTTEERDLNKPPPPETPSLSRSSARLTQALQLLQSADAAPTAATEKAVEAALREADFVLAKWTKLKG